MPANLHICYAVSCKRSPPGAPPACSQAPALPIPTAPDRPEISADMFRKAGLKVVLSFVPTFALTFAPAPTPVPSPSCPPPESQHNTAASALGSCKILLRCLIWGVTPVICLDHQLFQFFTASGKLEQDAILTGKP